jgi:hypothetical protein
VKLEAYNIYYTYFIMDFIQSFHLLYLLYYLLEVFMRNPHCQST